MAKEKVVFFGLSTEGYSLASQMVINGADVQIIDESASSAILLKPEIAKTYTNVISLREDEPLLAMEPSNIAISKAKYLFFTPRIRKTGQDLKTEVNSKFKDAVGALKKDSSVINCLATGFGGNNENISLLKHITGLDVGKSISYFYFPLNDLNKTPEIIGALKQPGEKKLLSLLKMDKKEKKFVDISSAEYLHAIDTIQKFSSLCSILEVCKFVKNDARHTKLFNDFQDLYLDDMITGLYDLRMLGSSFESAQTLMYLINGSVRGISSYIKRLIDTIRLTLKKNELKAAKTKIVLYWTLDTNEMRGDKIEMLNTIVSKLRDYIGDVETASGSVDLFHNDKVTIVVACSNSDYKKINEKQKDEDIFVIKANPLCEI
jgi:methyl-accepting chemotaxis protein